MLTLVHGSSAVIEDTTTTKVMAHEFVAIFASGAHYLQRGDVWTKNRGGLTPPRSLNENMYDVMRLHFLLANERMSNSKMLSY